jgi:hypothetical protein
MQFDNAVVFCVSIYDADKRRGVQNNAQLVKKRSEIAAKKCATEQNW